MRPFSAFRNRIDNEFRRVTDIAVLEATVDELFRSGEIGEQESVQFKERLQNQIQESQYCLRHLSAHIAIGAVFAFDAIPLPLGTISRVSWVIGARLWETVRRSPHAGIHSVKVFLIAAIPLVGYVAYTVPMRENCRELLFVLTNRVWKDQKGVSYETFLARKAPIFAGFGRWLVPRPLRAQ